MTGTTNVSVVSNPNAEALHQMDCAQRSLLTAFDLAKQVDLHLAQSRAAFERAGEVSINRNEACYQQVQKTVRDAYDSLQSMAQALLLHGFGAMVFRRMVEEATRLESQSEMICIGDREYDLPKYKIGQRVCLKETPFKPGVVTEIMLVNDVGHWFYTAISEDGKEEIAGYEQDLKLSFLPVNVRDSTPSTETESIA